MSKTDINEVEINGVKYVRKGTEKEDAQTMDGLKYVIIRGDRSGVFAGYLESRKDREVVLLNARRIWYWDGAASLSELATEGTSNPSNCKFPCEVKKVQILDVIEVIDCTEKSRLSIKEVSVWSQN